MERKAEYKRTLEERFIVTGYPDGEITFDLMQFETIGFKNNGELVLITRNNNILRLINISEHQYKRIRKHWVDTKLEVLGDYE